VRTTSPSHNRWRWQLAARAHHPPCLASPCWGFSSTPHFQAHIFFGSLQLQRSALEISFAAAATPATAVAAVAAPTTAAATAAAATVAAPAAAGYIADAAVALIVRVLPPLAGPGAAARYHDVALSVEISLLRRLRLGSKFRHKYGGWFTRASLRFLSSTSAVRHQRCTFFRYHRNKNKHLIF